MELFQAEWCPHSHRVRRRLTELGIDFTTLQVAADPEEREDLERVAGTTEIPVLVTDDGQIVCGDENILVYLERFEERDDASQHREKAREEVPDFA